MNHFPLLKAPPYDSLAWQTLVYPSPRQHSTPRSSTAVTTSVSSQLIKNDKFGIKTNRLEVAWARSAVGVGSCCAPCRTTPCVPPGNTNCSSGTNHCAWSCIYHVFNYTGYFSFLFSSSWSHFYCPASGQAVVTGVVPSPPRYVPSVFITHRVQHSHCSSIFIECCQLTLSRFPRYCTFFLAKITYDRRGSSAEEQHFTLVIVQK